MPGELMPMGGDMEPINAFAELQIALNHNWEDRGRKAASIVVASLTESPYVAMVGGNTFAVDVTNRFNLVEADQQGVIPAALDTVDLAASTLHDLVHVKAPGARSIKLALLKTKYRRIYGNLTPTWRTPSAQKDAFEGCLVGILRESYDFPIQDPSQALSIIKGAPRYVVALPLRDADHYYSDGINAVTTAGRMIKVNGKKGGLGSLTYSLPTATDEIGRRGGIAPSADIARLISSRVTELRTRDSKR